MGTANDVQLFVFRKIDSILDELHFTSILNKYREQHRSVLNAENGGIYHIKGLTQISIDYMVKMALEILQTMDKSPSISLEQLYRHAYRRYTQKFSERLVSEYKTIEKIFERAERVGNRDKIYFNSRTLIAQPQNNFQSQTNNYTIQNAPNNIAMTPVPSNENIFRINIIQSNQNATNVRQANNIVPVNTVQHQNSSYFIKKQLNQPQAPFPNRPPPNYLRINNQISVSSVPSGNQPSPQLSATTPPSQKKCHTSTPSRVVRPLRIVTVRKTENKNNASKPEYQLLKTHLLQTTKSTPAAVSNAEINAMNEVSEKQDDGLKKFVIMKLTKNGENDQYRVVPNQENVSSTSEQETKRDSEKEKVEIIEKSTLPNTISSTISIDSDESSASPPPLATVPREPDMPSLDFDFLENNNFSADIPSRKRSTENTNVDVPTKKAKTDEALENVGEEVQHDSVSTEFPIMNIKVEKDVDIETEQQEKEIRERVVRYIELSSDDDSDDDVIVVTSEINELKEAKFVSILWSHNDKK